MSDEGQTPTMRPEDHAYAWQPGDWWRVTMNVGFLLAYVALVLWLCYSRGEQR